MADGVSLENEVIGLLQTRRYDPEILPRLEAYVDHQVAGGRALNDADSNLAVLKLYQFYPAHYRAETVAKILIKALMTLPSTDFLCALYLVPDRRQVDEPIPVIAKLAELLETGCFKEFWEAAGSCRDLLESVPGSLEAVREFMAGVVARMYRRVDVAVLSELFELDEAGVREVCAQNQWEVVDGVVQIPANDENQPKPPTGDESLSFAQVAAKMLASS
jgi:translation initiation factor 3 subunit K